MKQGKFSWLHLTDLHFGLVGLAPRWPNIRESFFKDLEAAFQTSGPWDAVIFTGDLVQSGESAQYELLTREVLGPLYQRIDALTRAFVEEQKRRKKDSAPAAEITPPALLVVPGNHDLVRPGQTPPSPALRIMNKQGFRDIEDELLGMAANEYRDVIVKAFGNFAQWSSTARHCPATLTRGLLPGDFSARLIANGFDVRIVGLNTAFLQLDGGDFRERLEWDLRQFNAACTGDPMGDGAGWVGAGDVALLLTHHGPEWLSKFSREQVYAEINPAGRFSLHLFGHMHEAQLRSLSAGGDKRNQWQGNALFSMEKIDVPEKVERRHGYTCGRIETVGNRLTLRLFPRCARIDEVNGWRFFSDNDAVLLEEDGGTRTVLLRQDTKSAAPEASTMRRARYETPLRDPDRLGLWDLSAWVSLDAGRRELVAEKLRVGIAAHTMKIDDWSRNTQVFGMATPHEVSRDTAPLSFSVVPRKFRGPEVDSEEVSESYIVGTGKSYVILGQPGAGKTTTMKRLVRQLAFATTNEAAVIVIRLIRFDERHPSNNPLLCVIAAELGLDPTTPSGDFGHKGVSSSSTGGFQQAQFEGMDVERIVPDLLQRLRAQIVLDGLDEVNAGLRAGVERDIELLLANCRGCRFFLSCRSGDYVRQLGYLSAIEVCSLDARQIDDLASTWLGKKYPDFKGKLANPAFNELAGRPLFLLQLVLVYSGSGYLPNRPFDVYRMMTSLMLEAWDRQKDRHRPSRYSNFEAQRKLDFLARLSFELTYIARAKRFSSGQLNAIYTRIRNDFDLPADEERQVMQEIESHTGIIAESGPQDFEFSHLTIQEYLCAHHLVRLPFPKRQIALYLEHYPAPIAVATAMSSAPLQWLSGILLDPTVLKNVPLGHMTSYLDRLSVENPGLFNGPGVGHCILGLVFKGSEEGPGDNTILERASQLIDSSRVAATSFLDAICAYCIDGEGRSWDSHSLVLKVGQDLSLTDAGDGPAPRGKVQKAWLQRNFPNALLIDGYSITRRR